ncbi:MAG: hypothetical protein WKG32_07830 [Gemmatimonadaceae bacterium]
MDVNGTARANDAEHRPRSFAWQDAALLGCLIALALFLYQPWQRTPFEVTDFGEFLPFLAGNGSAGARLAAMMHYYASHGRIPILQYVQVVTLWQLFGADPLGWKAAKFVAMSAVVIGAYFVLRRLGAARAGAAAGAALFVCAPVSAANWLRVHITESSGLLLLLGAIWLAATYQSTNRWRRKAFTIAALVALAAWFKETFVAFAPFVCLVGACWQVGARLAVPRLDRRLAWLAGSLVVMLGATLGAFMIGMSRASAVGAYTSGYGVRRYPSSHWLTAPMDIARAVLLPVRVDYLTATQVPLVPANALFILLLAAGVTIAWRRSERPWDVAGRLAIALSIPTAAVALYLPWPVFQDTYALKFLLGAALLLALAVTWLGRYGSSTTRALALAIAVVTVGHASLLAHRQARRFTTRSTVESGVAAVMREYAKSDSMFVTAIAGEEHAWAGLPATLARYASLGGPAPVRAVGIVCDSVGAASRGDPSAPIFLYVERCAHVMNELPPPPRWVRGSYTYVHWRLLRPMTDSVRVNIWPPRDAAASRETQSTHSNDEPPGTRASPAAVRGGRNAPRQGEPRARSS